MVQSMRFTKMHGCGNDYIYINGFEERVDNPNELAIHMSNRHFGIGSDGLVLIMPSEVADFKMRMFNSDGTEAEMCGNATRCVAKYVFDKGLTCKETIILETLAGNKILEINATKEHVVNYVKVDMGEPILKASEIPVKSKNESVINEIIIIDEKEIPITCVSMGNPHAIVFIDEVLNYNVEKYGKIIEKNEIFPKRTNVEFVEVVNRDILKMRVWERGAGETLACGTGACASLVAAVINNKCDRKVTLKLLGGDLYVEWDLVSNHVIMSGPAKTVFEGNWVN